MERGSQNITAILPISLKSNLYEKLLIFGRETGSYHKTSEVAKAQHCGFATFRSFAIVPLVILLQNVHAALIYLAYL